MFPKNETHPYSGIKWKQKGYSMHILSFLYHRDGSVSVESYNNRDTKLQVCHQCPKVVGENKKCFNPAPDAKPNLFELVEIESTRFVFVRKSN